MSWLKSILGRGSVSKGRTSSRGITVKDPLIIENPKIAFLNLIGPAASSLLAEDTAALKPLFSECLNSAGDVPICDVLMIYATITPDGVVQNTDYNLREIISKSQAPIVVVATENTGESYIAASKRPGLGKANLVMTLKRQGRIFPEFFKELFGMMNRGVTMPIAWVKLAPQIPGKEHENVPGTICAMEVTHVLFK
ncbi:MAG TPA: hypothetical protein VNB54_13640 [Alphaproteobacteria bacterium]|nr:hypothetical protein [Alphaproteobacteria bacterium]